MARTRTPTAVMETRGSFKKHPERKRNGEPKPALGTGLPPDSLNDMEKDAWHELVSHCAAGVLTVSDRVALEMASCLLVDWRTVRKEMKSADKALLERLLSRFGMTPADRSKVVVPDEDEEGDLAEFRH